MDLSNLTPAVKQQGDTTDINNDNTEVKNELRGRVISDPEEIAAIEAKKKQTNIIVDAATRTAAQMRLEACENGVTIESVYNERITTLMGNKSLDEDGFKFAKMIVDGAFKVAKELGVPDKEDAHTILLLAKIATGEFNPREELQGARILSSKKPTSTLTLKEKNIRKKKSKRAKMSRKTNRK